MAIRQRKPAVPPDHVRFDYEAFRKLAPGAHAALLALGKAVDESGLDKAITELVKLRASQINGCAFCVQIHLNVARKIGVDQAKLDLVAAWKDAGVFSAKECAALAWTETLTDVSAQGASDEAHADVREHFTESEVVFLTLAIGTINNWNRLGVALRFAPPIPPVAAA
jgi:AhpD family alkylhydroperoxidase